MSQQADVEQSPPPPSSMPGGASPTASFVGATIGRLQEQYVGGKQPTPYSRAALARLRRGLGKPVGTLPDLLEFVIDPGALRPRSDEATAEEVAAYTAVTLYALHQQSQRARMHRSGRRFAFASAVGSLRYAGGEENEGVLRRFRALGTASGIDEIVQHARGLITLLRSAERGFDYGRFAQDLVDFQNPRRTDAVRLAWGRDFYRVIPSTDVITEEQS